MLGSICLFSNIIWPHYLGKWIELTILEPHINLWIPIVPLFLYEYFIFANIVYYANFIDFYVTLHVITMRNYLWVNCCWYASVTSAKFSKYLNLSFHNEMQFQNYSKIILGEGGIYNKNLAIKAISLSNAWYQYVYLT